MVAFRKLFPVLAIGAFLLGTATTASAQTAAGQPLVCSTDAGVPPVVRAESHTDLVGDIVLICSGGDPNRALTANFQLFLNTNITSRLLSGGLSEALLMIDEPGAARLNRDGSASTSTTPFCVSPDSRSNSTPTQTGTGVGATSNVPGLPVGGLFGDGTVPTCNATVANQNYQQNTYTIFRGQPATAANGAANAAVVWPAIPVVPPGTNQTRTIRITNIRANAAGVPASTSLVPTQIFSFLSISASQSLALNNPQQAVAFVLPGLQFDVRTCTGSGTGIPRTWVQCVSEPGASSTLFNNPSAAGPFGAQLGLRFREGFQTAFKTRIEEAQANSIPGVVYNTESGFVRTTVDAGSVGLGNVGVADAATRVAARFTNVPAGTRIFVSTTSVQNAASSDMGSTTAQALLVATDPNGAGGTVSTVAGVTPVGIPGTTTLSCSGNTLTSAAAEVPITNGSGMAVWEVTAANSANIDTLFFYMAAAFAANTPNNLPGLGQSSVTGSFAPFYAANSNANAASSSLPIPRFIDNATPRAAFTINQCVTNLLFPFVTNQAGFDTGLVISNTSRDPFSGSAGRLQAGTCTLNYYGATPGGPAPSAQTTNANVEAGNQVLWVLSSGGGLGITGTPGFQGYIIAQCRFQFAHGFAFITDGPIGQARVAEGYLALVMDAGITSRTGSFSEVLAH